MYPQALLLTCTLLVLLFIIASKFQILIWRLLCLLDEAVQENHPVVAEVEQDTRNAVVREICTYFVNSFSQWPANWHTNRPAKFNGLDIFTDSLPIFPRRQTLEPITHRFPT